MTKQKAEKLAQKEADNHGIQMVVYEDPYAEHETDRIGYMPAAAISIFKYHKVLKTIEPTI